MLSAEPPDTRSVHLVVARGEAARLQKESYASRVLRFDLTTVLR